MKTWRSAIIFPMLFNIASIAVAAESVKYAYDAKGRLIRIVRSGTVNDGVVTELSHDKADNRTHLKVTGSPNAAPPS